jgi:hypothetical protein
MMCMEDIFGELWSRFVRDYTDRTMNYSEQLHIQVHLLVFLKKIFIQACFDEGASKDCAQCRQLIDKVQTLEDSDTL